MITRETLAGAIIFGFIALAIIVISWFSRDPWGKSLDIYPEDAGKEPEDWL